jgi:glycosyltransferase involved in cell wall biosynthesis
MAKADLHIHSKYSEHPSEWFLQRIGASESYTEPESIYRCAKENGMDFVTITDHNHLEGSLLLNEKHPSDTFTGIETTTYFPENGCKMHILIYGLNTRQYDEIQKIRTDIYDLREYIREQNLAYSVAHATYPVNDRLSLEIIEKLMLLFDVFEGINGGRNQHNNSIWMKTLKNLNPSIIESLRKKYGIEPFSQLPWLKGITAGSDDHAGIFAGRTYTISQASTPAEFLEKLKFKATTPEGRHNDFQSLAFTIYKIAYDFSKAKSTPFSSAFLDKLNRLVFEKKPLKLNDKINIGNIKLSYNKKDNITRLLLELIDTLRKQSKLNTEEKLGIVYDKISSIFDEFVKSVCGSLEHDLAKGDVPGIITTLSSSVSGIFMSIPFFSTFKHLYHDRAVADQLSVKYSSSQKKEHKILWFTDSLCDLNGVSSTVQEAGWAFHNRRKNLSIVACLEAKHTGSEIPPNVIRLPFSYAFKLPRYGNYTLKVPSLLKALKILYNTDPDEIYISTQGPVGLAGLLFAKLFNTRCTGIYHADFFVNTQKTAEDDTSANMLDLYTKWFYSMMDEIHVPTMRYKELLSKRGFDDSKMRIFRQGIDTALFKPVPHDSILKDKYGVQSKHTILLAGRITKEKNIDFAIQAFKILSAKREDTACLIVGNGPYLNSLKKKHDQTKGLRFIGAVDRKELPVFYTHADVFISPGSSDTFGISVLEAQACGAPAIVSDSGGQWDIIINGKTGFILPVKNPEAWAEKLDQLLSLKDKDKEYYEWMRFQARENVFLRYDWDVVIESYNSERDQTSQSKTIYNSIPLAGSGKIIQLIEMTN